MKTTKNLLLALIICIMASCQQNKVDKTLADNFRKEYESLSSIQKSIEQDQTKFFAEKDTLVYRLRQVKGTMDASVEDFNENYRKLLENQDEIVNQHNNVLGEIALLEDKVLKGEITNEEARSESIKIIEDQKAVLSLYQKTLSEREALLKQYRNMLQEKAALQK
jgi:hypothetical protein